MQKRTPDMKALILLIATIPACFAQVEVTKRSVAKGPAKGAMAQLKPGIISGRIFLITEGGDIKPARMAELYLLSRDAVLNFTQGHVNALVEVSEELKHASPRLSDTYFCRKKLGTWRTALLGTLEWSDTGGGHRADVEFFDADKRWFLCDEDGNFNLDYAHGGPSERRSRLVDVIQN